MSQKLVANLLGHQRSVMVSGYEHGRVMPSLLSALRLGIILRVPVEFLFPELYDELRANIRKEEERLSSPTQQPLF